MKSFAFACFLCLSVGNCFAQDDSDSSAELKVSRHRLDFSLNYMKAVIDDSLGLSLGYAYNVTPKTNISASVTYLDSRVDKVGGSGIGDTSLAFSWTPAVNISVAPWVPKRIGTGLGVLLPTGNAADGRSLNSTILIPFVGLVFPFKDTFYIYPTFTYFWSADKIITDENIRIGVADIGVGWVSTRGFWITVYAAIVRDFDADDSHFNNQFSLGMVLSTRWSGSFDYVNADFFLPGKDTQVGNEIDKQFVFNLHFNF